MSATPSKKQNASLIRPRVYLGEGVSIGPGKIELLRAIAETHSITAAAKALHIPYKRAWILIDSLNQARQSGYADISPAFRPQSGVRECGGAG